MSPQMEIRPMTYVSNLKFDMCFFACLKWALRHAAYCRAIFMIERRLIFVCSFVIIGNPYGGGGVM